MTQHGYFIDNQLFPQTRADINAVLQAILTQNSGPSEPSVFSAGTFWYDSVAQVLKRRNDSNTAWVAVASVDLTSEQIASIIDQLGDLATKDTVGVGDLDPAVVGTTELSDGAATLDKLASNSVDATKVITNSQTLDKLVQASANVLLGRRTSSGNVAEVAYTEAGYELLNGSSAATQRLVLGLGDRVSLKDHGAVGDYTTDDTVAIDNAITAAVTGNKTLYIPRGAYKYNKTLIWPEGLNIIGEGAPKLATFPQFYAEKDRLRPGYKHLLSGSSIIFTGTGTLTNYTTNRSDAFSTVAPMVIYDHFSPYSIEGVAFIQDMDVRTAGNALTTAANDNRATNYTGGFVDTSVLSSKTDFCLFGYFSKAGYIVHNQDSGTVDPEYITNIDCIFNGGIALLGHDTAEGGASEGLTGVRFIGCGLYGSDHHSRADGIYTVPAIYIDGAVTGTAPNTAIRGHSFTACNIRGYANELIKFDNTNEIMFTGCTFEAPTLVGVANADAGGGFKGTSNTQNITLIGGASTGTLNLATFRNEIGGRLTAINSGGFDNFSVSRSGKGVSIAVDGTDAWIQLAGDLASTVNGYRVDYDGTTGNLQLKAGTSIMHEMTSTGGLITKISPVLTIASGEITPTGYYHTVDTEGDAATDDLVNIIGGVEGQRLLLRAASSSRTVVLKNSTGNLRIGADITLDNGFDVVELLCIGGSFWVAISFANNAG